MKYNDFIDKMRERIVALSVRGQAGVFWVFGSGLAVGLEVPALWREWVSEVSDRGFLLAIGGDSVGRDAVLWNTIGDLSDQDEMSEQLLCMVACISGPLDAGLGNDTGRWFEYAVEPLMVMSFFELFEDGDDEDQDLQFMHPPVQKASKFCSDVVEMLSDDSRINEAILTELAGQACILSPVWWERMKEEGDDEIG